MAGPNPVTYPFSVLQPDAFGADSNHPMTATDPMFAGSNNDAAGWIRRLESEIRRRASISASWEEWLGINQPYSPSPNPPTYVTSTSFTLTGDWTSAAPGFYPAIATVGRRIKAFTSANPSPVGVTGQITAASFSGGLTTITVLWDGGVGIDNSLGEVQFGIPATSPTIFQVKNGDQTISKTGLAFQTDADFSLSIFAGDTWVVQFSIVVFTNGQNSVTFQPLLPSGASYLFTEDVANTSTSSGNITIIQSLGSGTFRYGGLYLTVFNANGTSGQVQLQYSRNNSVDRVIKAGSFMFASKAASV